MESTHPAIPAPVPPARPDAVPSGHPVAGARAIWAIGVFELVKTVLFVAAAAGVYHLINRDTEVELRKLVRAFRLSGDGHFVRMFLDRAHLLDPYKLRITLVLLLYAALHATEGFGLLMRKRWAEYVTVVTTALPIPYELFLLVHRTTHSPVADLVPREQLLPAVFAEHLFVLKIVVLFINVGIVWFLLLHLIRSRARPAAAAVPFGG